MRPSVGLVDKHDVASSGFGYFTSAKLYVKNLWSRSFPKSSKNNSDDESSGGSTEESSTPSSSNWSSDSGNEVKQRLLLRKASWPVEDSDDDSKSDEQTGQLYETFVFITRFFLGLVVTQSFYLLMTFRSTQKAEKTAWWAGIISYFVAFGMAFSKAVRSIVALIVPSFSTAKGRSFILAFSLVLLLTGPSANIAHNYGEISRSLTCGDELGYNVTQGLRALIHNGQNAVLSTMEDTIDAIEEAVETADELFTGFVTKLQSVGVLVWKMNGFIKDMGSICSQRLGAFLCIIPNFVAKQAKKLLTEPLKDAVKQIKREFEFNMSYSHEFVYDVNASRTMKNVTMDIFKEVKGKASYLTTFFDWIRFAMGFSTILVVLKAVQYRFKYMTKAQFDNCYLTEEFIKLDKRKTRKGDTPVLPLRARENSMYINPNGIWMSRAETKRLAKGMTTISFTVIYGVGLMFADYSLWWLLHNIAARLSLRETTKTLVHQLIDRGTEAVLGPGKESETLATVLSLFIGGTGFVPIIYRAIVSALQRLASAEGYDFSLDSCLPNPNPPDYWMYAFILSLYCLVYILCLVESYILRYRRRIMAYFYPKRERLRLLFLRTKILSNRGLGIQLGLGKAIKNAFTKVQQSKAEEQYSVLSKLASRPGCIGWIARKLTGRTKFRCIVCKLAGGQEHEELFVRCFTFGCKGVYCQECYDDLHRLCIVCLMKESSKIKRQKRQSQLGLPSDEQVDSIDKKNRTSQSKWADELLNSSGISDSSATSSEDSDNENTDEESGARGNPAMRRSVRFKDRVYKRYIAVGNNSESETDA